MAEPEYASAEWYNAIAVRAAQRIMDAAKPKVQQYLHGGYAGGYALATIATLQKMPVQSAVEFLRNMMVLPSTRANGVKLFAQYLGWLERTGQLVPEAAKLLEKQMARAQVAGELT